MPLLALLAVNNFLKKQYTADIFRILFDHVFYLYKDNTILITGQREVKDFCKKVQFPEFQDFHRYDEFRQLLDAYEEFLSINRFMRTTKRAFYPA